MRNDVCVYVLGDLFGLAVQVEESELSHTPVEIRRLIRRMFLSATKSSFICSFIHRITPAFRRCHV